MSSALLYILVFCTLAATPAGLVALLRLRRRDPALARAMLRTVLAVMAVWFLYPLFQLIYAALVDCRFCPGSGYIFTFEVFLYTLFLGARSLAPGLIGGFLAADALTLPAVLLVRRLGREGKRTPPAPEAVSNPRRSKFSWWSLPALAAIALVAWVSALSVSVYSYSTVSDPEPADAAIVLGAAVWNGQPSPVFEQRVIHAIDLYRSGQVPALIFTGGVGAYDEVAESTAAENYALARGVPAAAIFTETVSADTVDNLLQAKAVARREGFGRLLIVSDPLHMRRAVTLARDLGLDAYPSPTPTSRYTSFNTRLEFLLREVYFLGTYRGQGAGSRE